MEAEIANIVQAIAIASNPLHQDKALQSQAVSYLAQVSENAQGDEVWKLALELFIAVDPSASGRKYDSQTRLFALRLLETFLDSRRVESHVDHAGARLITQQIYTGRHHLSDPEG